MRLRSFILCFNRTGIAGAKPSETWYGQEGNAPSKKLPAPLVEAVFTRPSHTSPTNGATLASKGLSGYTLHLSLETRTQRHTGRTMLGNEEPPHIGRLGWFVLPCVGVITPVSPLPFFRSSPAGSVFLRESLPWCRERCGPRRSSCAEMSQTNPRCCPAFPCRLHS